MQLQFLDEVSRHAGSAFVEPRRTELLGSFCRHVIGSNPVPTLPAMPRFYAAAHRILTGRRSATSMPWWGPPAHARFPTTGYLSTPPEGKLLAPANRRDGGACPLRNGIFAAGSGYLIIFAAVVAPIAIRLAAATPSPTAE
ncbi:hypothetical protein Purlil1_12578 [Purpureocillium lilacinum]|uniref:Uncharacterized protein n=1 Tax=Purpureocillium lilacinum TaxID=33203 RepID=A0ABR0BGL9_PURLI|nr:hypothetical protein Purlil1_12578 [Purpureocillium lilacinum]